jgi:hypothetical protein
VPEIPNTADIKDFVFNTLRTDQPYLCWAYYDPKFHEVTFFYELRCELRCTNYGDSALN